MTYRLVESLPYLLNRVGVRFAELFSHELAPQGLTMQMYRVLAALHDRDEQVLGELATMTTIEISTLSRMIGGMINRGLVARRRQSGDSRFVRIQLTRRGAELVERLIPIAVHYEEVAAAGLDREDLVRLKSNLTEIFDHLGIICAEQGQVADDAAAPQSGEDVSTVNSKR